MYCFESWERKTLSILSSWNKTLRTHLFQITLLIITSLLLLSSWRDFSIYVLLKSCDIILVLSPQILSFSVSTCILCKRYLLWICMTFSHFFIAMIVLPDVWLTFLTKKKLRKNREMTQTSSSLAIKCSYPSYLSLSEHLFTIGCL